MGWEHLSFQGGKPTPVLERFWARVTIGGPDDCWPFRGRLTNVGYCHIYLRGNPRIRGDRCEMLVHRFSWEIHNGLEIPPGLVIDHLCKCRICVNPKHLRVTTQKINSTENSNSPMAVHARKTHCKQGHPLSPENIAIIKRVGGIARNGKRTGAMTGRVCLTCYPHYWRKALIPREPPPRKRRSTHNQDTEEK